MAQNTTPPSAEFEQEIHELYHERNSRSFLAPSKKKYGFRTDLVALILFVIIAAGATSVIAVSLLQPMLSSLTPVERGVQRPSGQTVVHEFREDVVNRLVGSVVSVFPRRQVKGSIVDEVYLAEESLGQGLVLSGDGWLVTTQAVVGETKKSYAVATADGVVHEVEKVVLDTVAPLAYLKISARNLSATAFSSLDSLAIGQALIVPALDTQSSSRSFYQVNLANSLARIVTNRAELAVSSETLPDRYLLDRPLAQNLLGAPVATTQGEIVGLLATVGGEARAVVPLDSLAGIIDSLFTTQEVNRPVLGVTYVQNNWLSPYMTTQQETEGATLVATSRRLAVMVKSPAANAGLREGDIITAVAGERLKTRSLSSVIQQYRPGTSLELEVSRSGKVQTITVVLGGESVSPPTGNH